MRLLGLLGRAQLRFFRRSPWSTVTVLLGVALGVASIVAVHQINLRVNETLAAATPMHLAGITHLLERSSGKTRADDYFSLRGGWRSGLLPQVVALVPVVEGQVDVDGMRTQVFATDWLAATEVQIQANVGSLSLVGRNNVVADAALGLAEGVTISVAGVDVVVIATVRSGLGPALFVDIGVGQEILDRDPGALSYVAAVRRDARAWVKNALEQVLPGSSAGFAVADSWRIDGWRVRPVGAELPAVGFARSVLFNLGALGSLTLVVAWFLIYQVAVVWHRQRRPLMERLYMLGVSRVALQHDFVLSFVLVGTVATGLGLLVGPQLANLLSATSVPGTGPPVAGWAVVKGALSGVGISLLGAWMACRDAPGRSSLRWLLLAVLLTGLVAGVVIEASGLLGAFVAIMALCLLGVLCVRPLLGKLRGGQPHRFGSMLSRIGVREVVWYPTESSVAIGALALAVGASMGVGIMVENFRGDLVRMLDQRLAHDTFVTGAGRNLREPYLWLQSVEPRLDVQRYGSTRHRIGEWSVTLGYADFSPAEARRYGLNRALGVGEALVNERLARAMGGLVSGEVIGSGQPLRVAGVFSGFSDLGMRVLVGSETAERMGIVKAFDRMSVSKLDPLIRAKWVAAFPWLRIQSRTQMRDQALKIFDRTFAITRILTLLSVLVASVGMYNALLALRLNQSRSERLLHVLGVSVGERRGIVLRRALIVGGAAVLLALPLGLGMAWLLGGVVNPRAFGWSLSFSPTAAEVALPLVMALLVAVTAGLLPTPRGEQNMAEVEGV